MTPRGLCWVMLFSNNSINVSSTYSNITIYFAVKRVNKSQKELKQNKLPNNNIFSFASGCKSTSIILKNTNVNFLWHYCPWSTIEDCHFQPQISSHFVLRMTSHCRLFLPSLKYLKGGHHDINLTENKGSFLNQKSTFLMH